VKVIIYRENEQNVNTSELQSALRMKRLPVPDTHSK